MHTTLNKAIDVKCIAKSRIILKAVCTLSLSVAFWGATTMKLLNSPQMEYLEKFHLVHSNEMMGPQLLSECSGMSCRRAGCLLLQIKSGSWVSFWTCPSIESIWCIGLNTCVSTSYTGLSVLLFYFVEFGEMFKLTRNSHSSLEKKKGKKPPLGA